MKRKVPMGKSMAKLAGAKPDLSGKIKGKPKAVGKPKLGNSGKMKKLK